MEIDAKTTVSIAELAVVLGITSRRVRQLAQDGIISSAEKGEYPLADSVQGYVDFRASERPVSKAETDKLNADVVIKKAKATMLALEVKELQGKMHRSKDVAAMTEDLIYNIRGALVALPGRLAVDAAAASTPSEVSEIIRKEVYQIMEELSQYRYDAKKYEERVRGRMNWDSISEELIGEDEDD